MAASDIRAGAAFVELYADGKRLKAGLTAASASIKTWSKSAQKSIDGFGKVLKTKLTGFGSELTNLGTWGMGLFGGAGAGFLGAAKQFADTGDALEKMSQRTGMSAEALSELKYAADLSGTSIEDIESSIKKMQMLLMEAGEGSKTANDKLFNLGLTFQKLSKLSPEEQFETLLERISKLPEAKRAAAAMDVLGKSASGLVPLINSGAAGIAEMRKEAQKLGLTMSTEDAKSAAKLTDAIGRLQNVFKAFANSIGAALAPELSRLANLLAKTVSNAVKWIKENKEWIILFAKITAAVFGLSAVIFALGIAITGFGAVVGAVFSAAAGLVGLLGSAIAFVISPLGLLITAVTGLGGYFLYEFGVVNDAVEWLKQSFGSLSDTVSKAWSGIMNAIAAGRLDLALAVAVSGLKLVWTQGINFMLEWWYWLQNAVLTAWNATIYALASILIKGWAGLQSFWIDSITGIKSAWLILQKVLGDTWRNSMKGIRDAWDISSTFIAKGIGWIMAKMQGLDPEEMMRIIEEDHQTRQIQRNGEFDTAQKAADEQFQSSMAKVGQENIDANAKVKAQREGSLSALQDDYSAKQKQRQDAYQNKLQELQDDEIKAKEEFNNALKEAELARSQVKPEPEIEREAKQGQYEAVKTVSTGTFSAAAVQSLQSQGPMDKIAHNTELTAKYVKKQYEKPVQPAAATAG
ncbi:hypothetical protein FACS1894214_0980 [Planctomycetales bacterium]|nr:hypothetical protein FACS1894214_0980 [Planctomycetales bacterium]